MRHRREMKLAVFPEQGRLQALRCCGPQLALEIEHLLADADSGIGSMSQSRPKGGRFSVPVAESLILVCKIAIEWWTEGKHLKHHGTNAEYVGFGCELPLPDLGRHGRRCPTRSIVLKVAWPEDTSHTKINHHCMWVTSPVDGGGSFISLAWHQHDVRSLEVKVNDAPSMHMRDSLQNPSHDVHHERLLQEVVRFLTCGDQLLDSAALAEVHHQVDLAIVLVMFVQLDNIWMIESAEVGNLIINSRIEAAKLIRQALEGTSSNNLNGSFSPCTTLGARQIDNSIGTTTQLLLKVVCPAGVLLASSRLEVQGIDVRVLDMREEIPEKLCELFEVKRTFCNFHGAFEHYHAARHAEHGIQFFASCFH
mmetsp:Transcript_15319/g.27316  ORF Transcript_15319/g.27316 Transcript_15319/m.27316 type:complete len:365 (+) Transcript_15319:1254-2348(+)